jgi:hypothetical protein
MEEQMSKLDLVEPQWNVVEELGIKRLKNHLDAFITVPCL